MAATNYVLMTGEEVDAATGTGKSARYDRQDPTSTAYDPDWPKPIVLSPRCVRYRSDEVQAWLDKKSVDRALGAEQRREQAKVAAKKSQKARQAKLADLAGQA